MKELLEKIGKIVSIKCTTSHGHSTFKILVKIIDVKNSYGRTRYLVEPVSGEGQIWTEQII